MNQSRSNDELDSYVPCTKAVELNCRVSILSAPPGDGCVGASIVCPERADAPQLSQSAVKRIRARLGVTQRVLAAAIGCTHSNLVHVERGAQGLTVPRAKRLITFAASLGHVVTLDQIYADPEPAPQTLSCA